MGFANNSIITIYIQLGSCYCLPVGTTMSQIITYAILLLFRRGTRTRTETLYSSYYPHLWRLANLVPDVWVILQREDRIKSASDFDFNQYKKLYAKTFEFYCYDWQQSGNRPGELVLSLRNVPFTYLSLSLSNRKKALLIKATEF